MQIAIAFACLLACAAAFPQLEGSGEALDFSERSGNNAEILRSDFDMSDDGGFQYGFETSDGTAVDVSGDQRQVGEQSGVVMQGSYSYVNPEGKTVSVTWVADEGGFRAQGDSIPETPEYVKALLKSLPVQSNGPAPAADPVAEEELLDN